MKIKEITDQHRRDFMAIYECEHCGTEEEGTGYDDDYFHRVVIPKKKCEKCGKGSSDKYSPLVPKYGAHEII